MTSTDDDDSNEHRSVPLCIKLNVVYDIHDCDTTGQDVVVNVASDIT